MAIPLSCFYILYIVPCAMSNHLIYYYIVEHRPRLSLWGDSPGGVLASPVGKLSSEARLMGAAKQKEKSP